MNRADAVSWETVAKTLYGVLEELEDLRDGTTCYCGPHVKGACLNCRVTDAVRLLIEKEQNEMDRLGGHGP